MTSPYSTPRYPGAPNPTPRSTQKALRPPIFNPYDKFTQPEFDAWITDITGALKRALGRDDAPSTEERVQSTADEDDAGEELVEDSFAEVKARRLAKGKERARDEDFEQEEVRAGSVQEEDEERDGWGEPFDDAEYSSGESKEASPEVIDLLSDDEESDAGVKQPSDDDGEEASEGEEAEDEAMAEYDEEDQDDDVHSEDAQGSPRSSPAEEPYHATESYAHEVTEILDSDEEPEEAEAEEEEEEHRVLPARFQRKPDIVAPAHVESEDEEEYEDELDEEQAEEQADPFPPQTERKEPVDIDDPWRGPATYAEDFYSGGDVSANTLEHKDPHTLPGEEDELPVDEAAQTPDLSDPWEGPRTFAEDFYAGGDALPTDGVTPSHLTPKDEGPVFIPGVTDYSDTHERSDAEVAHRESADVDSHKAADAVAPEAPVDVAQEDEDDLSDAERSPSPPSATLRTHVDWNWPPAFPGRIATGPGHIASSEREVFEISDDDEDEDDDIDDDGFNSAPAHMLPDRPAQTVEPEPTSSGGVSAEQAPLSVDAAGDVDLYAEFDELYDMAAENASYNTQASFEPISPPGLDFGTLPPPMGLYSRMEADQDIQAIDLGEGSLRLEDLGDLQYIETSSARESMDRDAAVTENVPTEAATETRRFSVGLEEVTDEDDSNKHAPDASVKPQADELQANEPEMVVSEVEDDEDDIRSSVPPVDDIDIASVRSEVEPSVLEYVVEEVMTEGRRTEEPDQTNTDEGNGPSVATEDFAIVDNQAASQEDESLASQPAPEPAELASEAPIKAEAPVTFERTLSSSSNFPPPVSANPNVPDPASLSHTPLSPASPELRFSSSPAPEGHDVTALPTNAALHPLFRKLASVSHSPSGLFTPLTAENSASVTPERGEPDATEPAEENGVRQETDENPTPEPEGVPDTTKAPAKSPEEVPAGPDDGDFEQQPSLEDGAPDADLTAEAEPSEHEIHTETMDEAVGRDPTTTAEADADADAEGEDDAEYVPTEDVADSSPEESQAVVPPEVDESPQVAAEVPGQPDETNGTEDVTRDEAATPVPDADSTPKATAVELDDKTVPELDAKVPSSPARESVTGETEEARPLKRKRKSPTTSPQPTRLTRSRSSLQAAQRAFQDVVEQQVPKARKGKGKGKQRADAETDEEDNASVANSHVSESTSGGSSTAAQKMLVPDSRGNSRASSVVSNAPSTYSGLSQPSPTIDRILPSNGNHFPPPPFIHNHGILHHHHGRPIAPVVPPVPKRQPSEPPASVSEVVRRASAEPGPSSQPVLSRAPSIASTSSPVTRSNCRFHMISVSKEEENEGGSKLLFAVPGCALGNAELMKDEDIDDLGLVKAEDIPRLIRDLDSLNLSPYLVGVLRQLVGVDLLREQEVFYIPRRDDGVVIKSRKKAHRAKPKKMESISARTLSTASASRSKEARSMAPPSQASVSTSGESASFAGRLSQRASVATTASMSASELSELEDEAPPTKRAKETHPEADPTAESETQPTEPPSAAPSGTLEESASTASTAVRASRKLQPRRSRRLGVDAAAYKPQGGDSDGSDGEEDADTKKRRKRGTKRGLKRTRTEENGENADAPAEGSTEKPKKRRIRASTSNGDKGAAAAAEEGAS